MTTTNNTLGNEVMIILICAAGFVVVALFMVYIFGSKDCSECKKKKND